MSDVHLPQELAVALIEAFEKFELELEARGHALRLIKEIAPQHAGVLDESLSQARSDPARLACLKEKYDAIREQLHVEVFDEFAQKKIDQLIERLQPTTLLN